MPKPILINEKVWYILKLNLVCRPSIYFKIGNFNSNLPVELKNKKSNKI